MNYYERHLGDYAKDTAHLSMLEHGAYSLLLDRYYSTEQGIPEDQAHRVARARSKEERAAVDTVLSEFFILDNGVWINNRVVAEIGKHHKKMASLRDLQNREEYRRHRSFVLMRDGFACVYCGNTQAPLQLDQVIPRSRGGSDAPDNLAAACRSCNQRKGTKTPEEWFHV